MEVRYASRKHEPGHRHRRRRRDRQRHRLASRSSDPAFRGTVTRRRARSELRARVVGAVGELDPAAVLDRGEHRDRTVRHRVPARRRRASGRRRRAPGDRPRRARLPVPGFAQRRGDRSSATMRCSARMASTSRCLTPDALRQRFPWLSHRRRRVGLARPVGRGLVRRLQPDAGVPAQGAVAGARATFMRRDAASTSKGTHIVALRLADGTRIAGDAFVNAAGPWAPASRAGSASSLPVRARRRCVFVFACPTPLERCPLVIDTSGVWFRPEGTNRFICGVSPDPDERSRRPAARCRSRAVRRGAVAGACGARSGVRGAAAIAGVGRLLRVQHVRPQRHRRRASAAVELVLRERILRATACSRRPPWGGALPSCSCMAATERSTCRRSHSSGSRRSARSSS